MASPSPQFAPSRPREKLRTAIALLGQVEPIRTLGQWAYRHVTRKCLETLRAPGLVVNCRPSFDGRTLPGISDLDFVFTLVSIDPDEQLEALLNAREKYQKLKHRYRLPGEVLVFPQDFMAPFLAQNTALGWYLGYHDCFSSTLSQLGLALQFYALAVERLRLAIQFGQNSFHTTLFLREMRKAFATLHSDRNATLPPGDAASLMAAFLEKALAHVPILDSPITPRRVPPEESLLLDHCQAKLLAPHARVRASSVPLLACVDIGGDALARSHVQYLRAEGHASPLLLLPSALAAVIEQGYCGWRHTHPARQEAARRERAWMEVPNLLGMVVYAEPAELSLRLSRAKAQLATLKGGDGLSLEGFRSTV
ncbi:MAG: hypothetical protein KDD51_12970 [Bdellovibrionales bacterium]|nr:hypothetical protein [Bdellovibrionales bacterium]